ncbi:hypothetical protein EV193_104386 [Herbihabitans rhizosphaerae]|uniref:DUF5076 domain-containing protein n=1 Tax=Herbihabitans rhizosphaerae TaxID=1872711 RepID=A0A4Q7KSR7_9PSEU|nr:hypothetical protein [Herbihabitans rhizosphaerae]RZS39170.1 hypothetical protein EV193_104386 [Herbihabitans rhizosphaerae]
MYDPVKVLVDAAAEGMARVSVPLLDSQGNVEREFTAVDFGHEARAVASAVLSVLVTKHFPGDEGDTSDWHYACEALTEDVLDAHRELSA